MTEPTADTRSAASIRTVEAFLGALTDRDLDTADSLLADDVEYENVGLPTVHGRHATIKAFRGMQRYGGVEVKTHRIAAAGSAVLTERSDAMIIGPLRVQLWICGVFEVHDGKITLWRDYFDYVEFFKAAVRAVAALVFPSLRPTF